MSLDKENKGKTVTEDIEEKKEVRKLETGGHTHPLTGQDYDTSGGSAGYKYHTHYAQHTHMPMDDEYHPGWATPVDGYYIWPGGGQTYAPTSPWSRKDYLPQDPNRPGGPEEWTPMHQGTAIAEGPGTHGHVYRRRGLPMMGGGGYGAGLLPGGSSGQNASTLSAPSHYYEKSGIGIYGDPGRMDQYAHEPQLWKQGGVVKKVNRKQNSSKPPVQRQQPVRTMVGGGLAGGNKPMKRSAPKPNPRPAPQRRQGGPIARPVKRNMANGGVAKAKPTSRPGCCRGGGGRVASRSASRPAPLRGGGRSGGVR
jgi:hypothetical protein